MHALIDYVEFFIKRKLYKTGYFYLDDSYLFVKEKISALLIQQDLPPVAKAKHVELHKLLQSKRKISDELKILLRYQIFLNEKKLDNRYKKEVRKLMYSVLIEDGEVLCEREKHFYQESKVSIIFIDGINRIINNKGLLPQNENLFYRGHANLDWELKPSIYRSTGWINNEHNMFRDILIRNPNEFSQTKSAFEKLTIMQHYGLPTRLLDITKNPLVAMYFACSDKSQINMPGEVFIFSPSPKVVKFYDSDTVSILSNLSKAERALTTNNSKLVFNASDDGKKLLHLIKEEKPYFEAQIEPNDFSKTLIVKPINNNERIKRQLGYFFIFGIVNNVSNPAEIDFSYKVHNKVVKVIIDANKKTDIIDELEIVGISSNTLFPEIENGTKSIRENY